MIRQSNQSVKQLMATGKARTVCQANKRRDRRERREKEGKSGSRRLL